MRHEIAVIILNYKHPKDTINCLRSLLKADGGKEAAYYVVDNSAEEKFEKEIKKQFPKINYIGSPANVGFAAGNNQAIKKVLKSESKYILIINPDVTVGKTFFRPLVADFAKDKKAGIAAPAIRHQQKGITFFGLSGKVDWKTGKAGHLNLRQLPKDKTVEKAEFVTFACVLIKAEVFRKVGLLDERYFMYLEDVDFCLRVKGAGFHILLDQGVVVDHRTSSSFEKPTDKLAISFRSQLLFINKWRRFPKNVIPMLHTLLLYPYLYFLWTYHGRAR